MKKTEETNEWNADKYNKHAEFVSVLGMPVVDLLNPQRDEKILDLGCGDGTLAIEMQRSGAGVVAVDLSEDMVTKSREKGLDARVMSVTGLSFVAEFDGVFSNAVLHWISDSRLAVMNIRKALKTAGRFVVEFGGQGNVEQIISAMREVFDKHEEYGEFDDFWYFPSASEYQTLLEDCGFEVKQIELIPRPTPIDDIANWLSVFTNGITENLNQTQKHEFIQETREILKDKIYTSSDGWVADYVRLRVHAVKL